MEEKGLQQKFGPPSRGLHQQLSLMLLLVSQTWSWPRRFRLINCHFLVTFWTEEIVSVCFLLTVSDSWILDHFIFHYFFLLCSWSLLVLNVDGRSSSGSFYAVICLKLISLDTHQFINYYWGPLFPTGTYSWLCMRYSPCITWIPCKHLPSNPNWNSQLLKVTLIDVADHSVYLVEVNGCSATWWCATMMIHHMVRLRPPPVSLLLSRVFRQPHRPELRQGIRKWLPDRPEEDPLASGPLGLPLKLRQQ